MFIVRTSLRPSPIDGVGCFAEEPIKKGQVVWQFDPRFDIRIPFSELSSLPLVMQEQLMKYSYVELVEGQETMVFSADLSKHVNHSDHPNVSGSPDNSKDIAVRDIEVGEEITCDYYTFDLHAENKLGKGLPITDPRFLLKTSEVSARQSNSPAMPE
jgi:SET domain-containing protein